jgi:aldehyde dehydrogenase
MVWVLVLWTSTHMRFMKFRAIPSGARVGKPFSYITAGAPFGGYKQSGRENHKMMLGHYRQTKKHTNFI